METGRAKPSREMVLVLAEQLGLVDTSGPDYPLPLQKMIGDFEVDSAGPGRSLIRIRFTFAVRGGWLTELVVSALFASQGDAVVRAILSRWETRIEGGTKRASAESHR